MGCPTRRSCVWGFRFHFNSNQNNTSVSYLNFFPLTKTCHPDRSKPTLFPFSFAPANESACVAEGPLFDRPSTQLILLYSELRPGASNQQNTTKMLERLQKIIARAGIASRRHAEQLIVSGQVRVNGQVVTELGSKADPEHDKIEAAGKAVEPNDQRRVYIALNKPPEVVATMADPEGRKTLRNLLKGLPERVYPVGRLDYDASGLLFLTNDGDLAAEMLQDWSNLEQQYHVKIKGRLDTGDLARLGQNANAEFRTIRQPDASRGHAENFWYEVSLQDSKKDILRRVLFAEKHPVEKLKRIALGPLTLEGLPQGRYRLLDDGEVAILRVALKTKPKPRPAYTLPKEDQEESTSERPAQFQNNRFNRPPRFADRNRPAPPRRHSPQGKHGPRPSRPPEPENFGDRESAPRQNFGASRGNGKPYPRKNFGQNEIDDDSPEQSTPSGQPFSPNRPWDAPRPPRADVPDKWTKRPPNKFGRDNPGKENRFNAGGETRGQGRPPKRFSGPNDRPPREGNWRSSSRPSGPPRGDSRGSSRPGGPPRFDRDKRFSSDRPQGDRPRFGNSRGPSRPDGPPRRDNSGRPPRPGGPPRFGGGKRFGSDRPQGDKPRYGRSSGPDSRGDNPRRASGPGGPPRFGRDNRSGPKRFGGGENRSGGGNRFGGANRSGGAGRPAGTNRPGGAGNYNRGGNFKKPFRPNRPTGDRPPREDES
jgi:23S rRNA pseudouridine2605 synthase